MVSVPVSDWILTSLLREYDSEEHSRPFKGHSGRITSIEYSPDNRFIATGGSDGTVRLWDPQTGEQVRLLTTNHPVLSLTFCRSNRCLSAICGVQDVDRARVFVWNVEKQPDDEITPIETEYESMGMGLEAAHAVSFSSDGGLLAILTPIELAVQDTESGKLVARVLVSSKMDDLVSFVAFSSDDQHVVYAYHGENSTLEMRSFGLDSKQETGVLSRVPASEPLCCFPTGNILAGRALAGGIQIWSLVTGEATQGPLRGHVDQTSSMCFSPDGSWLIDSSKARTICVWDTSSGTLVAGPLRHDRLQGAIRAVACSPSKDRVACVEGENDVVIWDIQDNEVVLSSWQNPADERRLVLHRSNHVPINAIQWLPNGRQFISSAPSDDYIRTWDAQTGKQVGELLFHGGSIISLSGDGRLLAIGSTRELGTIVLVDAKTGREHAPPLMGVDSQTRRLQFAPDSSTLAVVLQQSGGLHLVRDVLDSRKIILVPNSGAVLDIDFSPDGKHLAYVNERSRSVRVCDTHTLEVVFEREVQMSGNALVSFSPDGRHLLGTGGTNDVNVWDVTTSREILNVHKEKTSVLAAASSPDGRTFIVSWVNVGPSVPTAETGMFDATSGESVWRMLDTENVTAIAFSPAGERIAISFRDGPIKVVEASTGDVILSGGVENPLFDQDEDVHPEGRGAHLSDVDMESILNASPFQLSSSVEIEQLADACDA
ncbi:WD40 repeat-like protein [Coniophora puteana RWD-64-598 SS2]|uniref:WD40 repeat-like protein n=1 Tax=Coniophora puteana (strain RWD-64-598) TaxID=741705 RepID=A0A5M3MC22_CONPW|nr:WD40 repeat-like protein [Coniophora puteana RWD-64-598 SS2]EIW76380.1 WD40 repeat-like protein [Coniophora puteana RWD-64-598 SS2]